MSQHRDHLLALTAELDRRVSQRRVIRDLHRGQRRAVWARRNDVELEDTVGLTSWQLLARKVALLTHRRWGKSEGFLRYLSGRALSDPTAWRPSHCPGGHYRAAYILQEGEKAWRLVSNIIDPLAELYGLNLHTDAARGIFTFRDTGGTIELFGADHPRFQRLLRGEQFDDVVVDEGQDFKYSNLAVLVKRVLWPTLADRNGRLFIGGTPGDMHTTPLPEDNDQLHFFYETAWLEQHADWVAVHGEYLENPSTAAQLEEQINGYKRANPNIEQEPWFQREYRGQWVADSRALVIQLREHNKLFKWKPEPDDRYTLGVDIGWEDKGGHKTIVRASAYVLSTWNPRRYPWTIYLKVRTADRMLLHDHRRMLDEFIGDYPDLRIVMDPGGSAKAVVEELRDTYCYPIEDAKKSEKMFYVERLNSEASLGYVKVFDLDNAVVDPDDGYLYCDEPERSPVWQQWSELAWVYDKLGAREEGQPRHVHDASLYSRRAGAPWLHEGPQKPDPEEERKRRQMREQRFATVRARRLPRGRERVPPGQVGRVSR